MSVRVLDWVFRQSRSRGADRLVLLAIADSVNDAGHEGWPSLTTIAAKAGVDRRSVSRCIANLERLGELERICRGGRTGFGGRSNSYRVVMDQGPDVTTNQGPGVTSDGVPLGASGDEVGTHGPKVGAHGPPNRKNRPNRVGKRTRAPESIEITDRMRDWAADKVPMIDIDYETPRFLDHHRAKGTLFVDWTAAWRTWMTNARKFAERDGRTARGRQTGSTQGYDPLNFEDA